jgi:hypothetical protein
VASCIPDFNFDKFSHVLDSLDLVINAHGADHVILKLALCIANDQTGLANTRIAEEK